MDNNKKRSSNFTLSEVEFLKSLVQKYWSKIECKKSNVQTWKQKNECWEELAREFNASNNSLQARPAGVLKKKWENCKKNIKQKVTQEKMYIKGTGGGPSQKTVYTESDHEMLSLLNIQATGNSPSYDCDLSPDCEEETRTEMLSANWDDNSPALLKAPISRPLLVNEETPILMDITEPRINNIVPDQPTEVASTSTVAKTSVKKSISKKDSTITKKRTATSTNKKWRDLADYKIKIAALEETKLQIEIANIQEQHALQIKILECELKIKEKQLEKLNSQNFI